jgi:hypothetical protein
LWTCRWVPNIPPKYWYPLQAHKVISPRRSPWTLQIELTCRRNMWSGWYLTGINIMRRRSKNCSPLSDAAPIYRNTPNRTGMGIWPSTGVSTTDSPIMKKIRMWVMRCSLQHNIKHHTSLLLT